MDGPTIAAAAEVALRGGVRVRDALTAVEAISEAGGRAVVMTYWNPVLRYGVDAFARDLAAAGGLGLITPDLIPDEADEWLAASDAHGLDRIFLVAPSSTPRAAGRRRSQASRGFVYAASTMGVTGARDAVSNAAPELVEPGQGGLRHRRSESDWACGRVSRPPRSAATPTASSSGSALVSGARRRVARDAGVDCRTRRRRAPAGFGIVTTTVLAYIPEPAAGGVASRARPAPRLRAVHHHRASSRRC